MRSPETEIPSHDRDRWTGADHYEGYMGRWSRQIAPSFLAWLDQGPGLRWLDVGCGTGALTGPILSLEDSSPSEVHGVDASAAFIERARSSVCDPRAQFETAVVEALPFEDGRFDVVVTGLLLNLVSEPVSAVRELIRVARPRGVIAVYVWDWDEMQMLRYFWDALLAQAPAAGDLDEVRRFTICRPEPLRALFREAGLASVAAEPLDVQTRFRDFNDYWSPFLAGKGAGPSHLMSLPQADRVAVENRVRSTLPRNPGGSIDLRARAWAVRGQVQA
ncbi:MAG: methyltransferase domain-containing protein [Actinomycetota bacterium]|nr:methyltransferase domain-containing protein [Actinomycetota bacterium]